MATNNNYRLNGLNPLAYMGVNPVTPVPFFSRAADPTTTDYANFILGTIWLNTDNQNIWMLVKLANFEGTWVLLGNAAGNLETLTGDIGVATPVSNNINVTGLTTAGSTVSFTGSTDNLKFNTTDANANTIIGNSAGNSSLTGENNVGLGFSVLNHLLTGLNNVALGAFAGDAYTGSESNNIAIGNDGTVGDNDTTRIGDTQTRVFMAGIYGVDPSGTNEVVTINSATGQLGSFEFAGNSGTALPQSGTFNVVGDGTTATTSAMGNTITITAIGGGGGGTVAGLMTDDSNTVTPTAGIINIVGGSGIQTTGTSGPNTVTISATGTSQFNYTNVNSTPYVVLTTDQYLSVDCSSSAITIQLPNAATLGKSFVIKDRTGSAATNNITVTTVSGTDLIDGATMFSINTSYEGINVLGNGSSYEIF